ncbi:hypothetical protein VE01_00417 [Pseudogymnoascus verrucosus]|uniref:Lysine-specific metallo-endopeptidase domain-containing protein n=1 Tax=Pseudogymnoascus verrucosus TaxID=342668 RepID=A0A2P2SXX3_9PEZI|nr:uncharacterized protein VE01_00417 [Pseudogymnoascus verrucosus]OBU01701.1 hypothetical protein VE01_00417 [Pseudogymnoascus verrucosus]
MCPTFFSTSTLNRKFEEMQGEMAKGNVDIMRDARYFFTSGHMFLHEMMHTDLIGQPHIIDEYIDPDIMSYQAYGPKRVHQLAIRDLQQGGGATRASTNADGYAWLASSLYWWDTTKYFPGVPNKPGPLVAETGPVILHLGDFDDFNTASSDDSFQKALGGLFGSVPVRSGTDLNSNFPRYWILDDNSKQDIKNIYYRLRDKACQNICDISTIQNVPSQFVRATRVGSTGCEYAIKISNTKELYLYTTQDGQNCYSATQMMIDNYGATKDSSWINRPLVSDLYQIGIRDINTKGPGGVSHDEFPADNQHLGFMHLACRRSDGVAKWAYDFNLKISGWDDGNWGKSIKSEADRCDRVLGTDHWKYEEEKDYKFSDGSAADHWRVGH